MEDVLKLSKKWIKVDSVNIDNCVSRIHYRVTVTLLVTFSLVVSARQFVGDPIHCSSGTEHNRMMDTFCWMHSTFTVDRLYDPNVRADSDAVYPGVGPYTDGQDTVTHHSYYKWVCFILLFQAVCFYAPRHMWKSWEGGRLKRLVGVLSLELVPGVLTSECNGRVVDYFVANLHAHGRYVALYLSCECLNLVNVLLQMVFLNRWFEGEFRLFGLDLYWYTVTDPDKRSDSMSRVFPRMTKCWFRNYGPSGTVQNVDSVCMLPLNAVNEYIYVFLWFWFLFIAVLGVLNLIYHAAAMWSSTTRLNFLRAKCRLSTHAELVAINNEFRLGDWFMFYQISKNCEPTVFKALVVELSDRLSRSRQEV